MKRLGIGRIVSISLTCWAMSFILAANTHAQGPIIDCSTELYGSSQLGDLFIVDIVTGGASFIGTMPPSLATEIEYELVNGLLWAEEVNGLPGLHTIDPTTAASTGSITHDPGGLTGLEFVGSDLYGTFIAGPGAPSDLVIVDTITGAFTTLGATGLGPISGLAYDEATGTMYGITAGSLPSDLVTLDLGSGGATVVGATGLDVIGSIEFGPDGFLYGGLANMATTNANFLVRIDTATGVATPIADTGFSITGLTSCASPVAPANIIEIPVLSPTGLAAMALLLIAASVFVLARRRRNPLG